MWELSTVYGFPLRRCDCTGKEIRSGVTTLAFERAISWKAASDVGGRSDSKVDLNSPMAVKLAREPNTARQAQTVITDPDDRISATEGWV